MAPKGGLENEKHEAANASEQTREAAEGKNRETSLKSLKKLEQEVATSANQENLLKLGNEVPNLCSEKALTLIDAVTKDPSTKLEDFDAETLDRFDTFIGWRLVGSVYGKSLRDARNPDGTIDQNKFTTAKQSIHIDTLAGLNSALQSAQTEFDPQEQKVMQALLANNNAFMKSYVDKRYGKVVTVVDSYVTQNLSQYNTYAQQHPELNSSQSTEEKGFWDKTKEYVKEHPYKTALGVAGVGLGIYGLYKLFSHKKHKKHKDDDEDEEGGFFDSTVGKIVKWSAIGGGAYWLIKSLIDGKMYNPFEDKANPTDTAKEQVDAYSQLDKETKEKYELTGTNVDALYKQLFGTELASGWQDDGDMETIASEFTGGKEAFKGVVPFCLDNKFGTVSDLVSEKGQFSSLVSAKLDDIKTHIFGWAKDKLHTFTDSFLGLIPSWLPFSKKTDDPQKNISEWIASNPEKHTKELQLFFRESMRVQTFLVEKRKQLVEKIVKDKLNTAKDKSSVEDKINDTEWMKTHVDNDSRLEAFDSGSIANATQILKNENILDASVSDATKERINALDEGREDILGGEKNKDILDNARKNKLSEEEKKQLSKSCADINKEIDNEVLDATKESAWNIFGDLFNTDDAAKREYLKQCDFDGFFGNVKKSFAEAKAKLDADTLSPEEAKSLADAMDQYFALKKELYTGAHTIQVEKDENGNYILRAGGFLTGSAHNLVEACKHFAKGEIWESAKYLWSGSFALLVTGAGLYMVNPIVGKVVLSTGTNVLIAPLKVGKLAARGLRNSGRIGKFYIGNGATLRKTYFGGVDGPQKLWDDFMKGHIKLERAAGVIDNGKATSGVLQGDKVRVSWETKFGSTGSGKQNLLTRFFEGGPLRNASAQELAIIEKYFDKGAVRVLMKKDPSATLQTLQNIENAGITDETLINDIIGGKKSTLADIESRLRQAPIVRGIEERKDVAKLGLNVEQTALHTNIVHEVEKIERLMPSATLQGKAIYQKEIETLQGFAKELKMMQPDAAKAIMELSSEIHISYLAKLSEEGADIKSIVRQLSAAKGTGNLDKAIIRGILQNNGATKFAEQLERLNSLDKFGEECVKIGGEAAKLVKLDVALLEILRLVKYVR